MSYEPYRPSRFQILPVVVKNLLIINGIFFLATMVVQDKFDYDLSEYLGLHFPTSDFFRPHQLITHLFMHGSFLHLLSNMFALWMFGNVLENYWGPKRFLTYYMVTGVGAALIQLGYNWYELNELKHTIEVFIAQANPVDFKNMFSGYIPYMNTDQIHELNVFYSAWQAAPQDPTYLHEAAHFAGEFLKAKADVATVGASGAVFGVLLAFGMMFPNTIIYIYFAIPMKAKWFVVLYGLFELYSGIENNPTDNVAHFAHLGGMLFGYLLLRLWKRRSTGYMG